VDNNGHHDQKNQSSAQSDEYFLPGLHASPVTPRGRRCIRTRDPGQDVDAETVSSPGCVGDGGRTSSDTIQRSGKFRLVSWQKWLRLRRNLKMVAPLGKR
jgi:hypothetical protein